MHDLEFEHLHVDPSEGPLNEVAWAADNVELTTVGIDIGSSTSHLMFARVHLQRLGTALSSRFVVVGRKLLWQSPILLTPYLPDYTIDVDELAGFIGGAYALCRDRTRGDRLGRRDPHRRGDQAQERARHRRPVLRGSRQVRLRLGRPSHGMPDVGARLGRGRAVARARRDAAQRRYRRRHHQARR